MSEIANKFGARGPKRGNPNWKPGVSGNPSGRPKLDPEYREKMRRMAFKLATQLEKLIEDGETPTQDEIRALAEFSDRGGLLKGVDLAATESLRGKLLLEALTLPNITEEMRRSIVAAFREHEREALGRADEAPQLEAADDDPKP